MPHVPGCGCPAPADNCPLDDSPPPAPSTRDLMRAALEGTSEQPAPTSSAGRPVALNDDKALTAIIAAALGGPVTTNHQ